MFRSGSAKAFVVRRTYDDFVLLDVALHTCVFSRKHSQLPELPTGHENVSAVNGGTHQVRALIRLRAMRLNTNEGHYRICALISVLFVFTRLIETENKAFDGVMKYANRAGILDTCTCHLSTLCIRKMSLSHSLSH